MAAPAQQAEEQEFLVIRSQGYSRYEITGNDVIAYITGGVDCTYLGFSIHADSVSYNQATKVAEAAGNIILGIPLKPEKTPGDAARATDGAPPGAEQITISCHSLMLSGTEGRLNIYGPLGGTIPRLAAASRAAGAVAGPALEFQSDGALGAFPPGDWLRSKDDLILELQGNVVVTGAEQSRLTCESLVYVGATSELNIPQHFTLTAQPGGKSPGEGNARIEFALLELTGDSLSAKIDEQSGQLQTARISLPVFNLPTGRVFVKDKTAANKKEIPVQGTITAGLAELNLPQAPEGEDGSTDVASWDMTLSGGPVHGEFLVDTLPYAFDTASAQVHSDPESGTELDLNGNVSITTTSQVITADSLQVLPAPGKGFKIVAKHGFNSQFNMAELSGRTPMKLPEILQGTPKQ